MTFFPNNYTEYLCHATFVVLIECDAAVERKVRRSTFERVRQEFERDRKEVILEDGWSGATFAPGGTTADETNVEQQEASLRNRNVRGGRRGGKRGEE